MAVTLHADSKIMSISALDGGMSGIAAAHASSAMSSRAAADIGTSAGDQTVIAAAVDSANEAVQVAALAQTLGLASSLVNIVV
jgi:hypothetical protein